MIIWLASYPRSGNTLIRTILRNSFGISTYNDDQNAQQQRPLVREITGAARFDGSWDSFYARASAGAEHFYVKTHRRPVDAQPAIYVARDGRVATESYAAYHEAFRPNPDFRPTLLDLIVGNDYYGTWASHFRAWKARREGRFLLVRYEELVTPGLPLLEEIACFIGYRGEVAPFTNPFDVLHRESPDFFRSGSRSWQRPAGWSEGHEALFLELQGDVMEELGYIGPGERGTGRLSELELELARHVSGAFEERNLWRHESEAKERVIQDLVKAASQRTAAGELARHEEK